MHRAAPATRLAPPPKASAARLAERDEADAGELVSAPPQPQAENRSRRKTVARMAVRIGATLTMNAAAPALTVQLALVEQAVVSGNADQAADQEAAGVAARRRRRAADRQPGERQGAGDREPRRRQLERAEVAHADADQREGRAPGETRCTATAKIAAALARRAAVEEREVMAPYRRVAAIDIAVS